MIKQAWTIFFTLTILFSLSYASLKAQQVYVLDGADIQACGGIFTDSGGETAAYGTNENFTITICPDDSGSGTHVQLAFSTVNLGPGDKLCFYDGQSVNAPYLACGADFGFNEPFIVQATAANNSGCITLTFQSDATNDGEGWDAKINCMQACQTIIAELASAMPSVMPPDTGWINVCPGQPVRLSGRGLYPQNGLIYQHSDFNSAFSWDFGDGSDPALGPNVVHVYDEPGGYVIQLTIEDQVGCKSTNFISQRVRVAPRPEFTFGDNIPSEVCIDEVVDLTATISQAISDYSVSVESGSAGFFPTTTRSDSLALPDGVGVAYETSIEVRDFRPGQLVTSANDIPEICINMEHSWMRDLEIKLFCPSGDSIILHQFVDRTGGEVYLGIPDDTDSAQNPNSGIGWDYCWTPDAVNSTWVNYANRFSPQTLPAGNYKPFDSFDNLIGCPLNGEWRINVKDLWARDNGFIFSWSINFEDDLFPAIEVFAPQVVDLTWENHPDIISSSEDSISVQPSAAGEAAYTLLAEDEFGCVHDTTINFTVLPPTHPLCFDCSENIRDVRDTVICVGESVTFNVRPDFDMAVTDIPFAANPNDNFGFLNTVLFPFTSSIRVTDVDYNTISDPAAQIKSICLDLETNRTEDLNVTLVSPNGLSLPLSLRNGNRTRDFPNTCFTPGAARSIAASNGPYTGEFLPEGSFNQLIGAQVNGLWTLEITDNSLARSNTLKSWSITFQSETTIDYVWDAHPDLQNPLDDSEQRAQPSATTSYYVEARDDNGCFARDTITVGVLQNPDPPVVSCGVTNEGEITFSWNPTPDVPAYQLELFINGVSTRELITDQSEFVIENLIEPDEVRLEVRPNGAETCVPVSASAVCIFEPCEFEIDTVMVQNVSCFGRQDASATVILTGGGAGNYTYQWDDDLAQISATANRLRAGVYTVRVTDDAGCMARMQATITEPDSMQVEIAPTNVGCFGESSGFAEAIANGGTLPYSYRWSDNQDSAMAVGLSAGSYDVLVIDANGCNANAQVLIDEPAEPLSVSIIQDRFGCFGESKNQITAVAQGGEIEIYNYLWTTGSRKATIMGLDTVEYTVTVTDYNECMTTASFIPEDRDTINPNIIFNLPSCDGTADGQLGVNFINRGDVTEDVSLYRFEWSNGDTTAAIENLVGGEWYAVTVTDRDTCSGIETRFLGLPDTISFALETINPNCAGGSDGAASIINAVGGSGGFIYQWSDNIGGDTAQVNGLASGNYSVTVSDTLNCESIQSFSILQPEGVEVSFATTDNDCFGNSEGTVNASVSGGTPDYTYAWSNGASGAQVNGLPAGVYELNVRDANGCETVAQVEINEPPILEADVETQDVLCFGDNNGRIVVTPLGGTAPYQYRLGNDGPFGTDGVFPGLGQGFYPIYLKDAQNCTALIDQVSINEPLEFRIDAGPEERTINLGDSTLLTALASNATGQVSYEWRLSFGDAISCTDCYLAWARPFYTTTYELFGVDGNGCKASDQIVVNVFKPRVLAVPTGFTPNEDGENDRLTVHGRAGTRVKLFQVYNRWGELLYEAKDFEVNNNKIAWDGSFRGQPAPSGIYLYYLIGQFLDGEEKIRKGQTTLIR